MKIIEVINCKDCPYLEPEDEDVDIYHGCAYTYIPPRCGECNKELDPKKLDKIPDWCPL
jgi:hypothetical protein